MASFSRQFTSSPVLTMPPQPAHQAPFGMAGFARQQTQTQAFAQAPAPSFFAATPAFSSPFSVAQQPARPSPAGRKRSRDEAASNLEPDALPPRPPQESEDKWVYGPGMTLIKADKSYVADASTQSGTWLEEKKANQQEIRRRLEMERQVLAPRSSKSQRVERGLGDAPAVAASASAPVTTTNPASTLPNGKQAPVVDDFTLHLGIGWRKISDDEHIQAAARGWARFIENHYPISNVQIRLESRGLQSYLVEASEGFFLFAENLRRGRLVSITVGGALKNLQSSPPSFDGSEEMVAGESPAPTEVKPAPAAASVAADTDMHMD